MTLFRKLKPFIKNTLLDKKAELDLLAKNPESTARRYLMGKLARKLTPDAKAHRRLANIAQDANDLLEYGDTQMSRRLFLQNSFKRVMDRNIVPEVTDTVRSKIQQPAKIAYPILKQIQDVADTTPNAVKLDKIKTARKLDNSSFGYGFSYMNTDFLQGFDYSTINFNHNILHSTVKYMDFGL